MKEYYGVTYSQETDLDVIYSLSFGMVKHEREKDGGYRFEIEYGDPMTGKSNGEKVCGYFSHSNGSIKLPIILHNSRSTKGKVILDNHIVAIRYKKDGKEIYKHPNYQPY